jgi:hypothetical protein
MGGSGYRPSRDTVAALYGAVRRSPQMRQTAPGISGPYSNGKAPVSICRGIPKNDPGTNVRLSLDNRQS